MVKHTEDLLITKVFSCCMDKAVDVHKITRFVYGNDYAKNEIHVYKVLESLIESDFVVPVVNGGLKYSINSEKIISMLIKSKAIVQMGNNQFKINRRS